MLPGRDFVMLACHALLRNRMQTVLAMLGVMVGVGALVTSIALGRGAQQAVEDQLRAAGANLIMVTAGNFQRAREEMTDPDGNIGHTALLVPRAGGMWPAAANAAVRPATLVLFRDAMADPVAGAPRGYAPVGPDVAPWLIPAHYEDDPLAMHDHPTAKDRLGDVTAGLGSAATLTRDDAKAIALLPGVQQVISGVHDNAHLFVADDPGKKQWFTRIHGTEAKLPEIRSGWTMAHGRFLNDAEIEGAAQVMVLGRVAADRLFGADVDPVGRMVTLWNQRFLVIGVVTSRSWASQPTAGDDQFDAAYMPVTTIDRLLNLSKLNTIAVTSASMGDVSALAKRIKLLLRQRHKIGLATPDDFTVASVAQQAIGKGLPPGLARAVTGNLQDVDRLTIEQLSTSLRRTNLTMLALLAGVATVSLLVGGIGVMNLLLLSVTQRTREVGLRIALGARRRDIATQFVLEAILLCLAGGALGVLGGVLASDGLQRFFQWSTVISPVSAVLAMLVAALLGIVFSVYPARRAAHLDPIEALRHE